MTIAEIKAMYDGTVIPPFSATLKFVNDHKGKSQSFVLEDESGEVKCQRITTKAVSGNAKGKSVRIEKAKAEDHTWDGRTTRRVVVFNNGVFEVEGSVSAAEPQELVSAIGKVAVGSVSHAERESCEKAVSKDMAKLLNGNGNGKKSFYQGFQHDFVNIMIAAYNKGDVTLEHFFSKEFGRASWNFVSDKVRESDLIESGKLAPSAKERAALTDPVAEKAKELFEGVDTPPKILEEETQQEQPW